MSKNAQLLLLFLALFLWGCRNGGMYQSADQLFVDQSNTTGAYVDGRQALIYDATLHQTARRGTSFRLQTDDQSTYLNLQLERIPTRQEPNVLCTINVRGVNDIKEGTYQMTWVDGRDGKIWIWNQEHKMGFIIPELQQ